ncbi:hypothetical protein [Clostridium sp.]|uniref:hypothetical protein n=1 Tax=Clostridium sp. TaxID=1506 RepID=UPI002FC9B78B
MQGKTVRIHSKDSQIDGKEYWIEGYWETITGSSWLDIPFDNMPIAVANYAMRTIGEPFGDCENVLYGKIGLFGYLVHESELGEVLYEGHICNNT